ncbi:MAG TPA: DUF1579 family protein [Fimbriimonadaceae bacterium]|nr:DUF1579 family protein [Fimbriimonadaceae bacterium]
MIIAPLLLSASVALAQKVEPPVETHQFDFWVGEWKCSGDSYGPDGKATRTEASNTITRDLGGHVVRENFRMNGLNGSSVSVYDPSAKLWRQTWVDDQGGYIALTGSFEGGKMTLTTLPRPDRPKASSRMVFSNIKADSFDWDWETSRDAGRTWKLAWHLHYTRAKT